MKTLTEAYSQRFSQPIFNDFLILITRFPNTFHGAIPKFSGHWYFSYYWDSLEVICIYTIQLHRGNDIKIKNKSISHHDCSVVRDSVFIPSNGCSSERFSDTIVTQSFYLAIQQQVISILFTTNWNF